jgi:gas vesicle protein
MIKTFEQFINENYGRQNVLKINEEYGSPLFNEISESLISEIHDSINEGRLVINTNVIEEGLFSTIGNLFKKGVDSMGKKIEDNAIDIKNIQDVIDFYNQDDVIRLSGSAEELVRQSKDLKSAIKDEETYKKIEEFCKYGEDLCTKLAEKEEEMYKTVKEKMEAVNEAVKDFSEQAIAKLKEIVEISKNKVSDVIGAVIMFCKRMAAVVAKFAQSIAKGLVFGLSLPFILAYSVYKGAVQVCNVLVEKVKDGAKVVKESFVKIKDAISTWVVDTLEKAKELLKKACDSIKDGATSAAKAIGKAYLAIVATLGQLASDVKDKISEAYNNFVEGAKEFADDVKAYISEKWDTVSKWCKKTATAFAEGVKNIWNKITDKVISIAGAVKDAYQTLKDNAKATWEEMQEWDDERKKEMFRAQLKYGVDEWGKDTVSDWLAAIQ